MTSFAEEPPFATSAEIIEHAGRMLHPDDAAAFEMLADMPDANFTLGRPQVEPSQAVMEPLQDYIGAVLSSHERFAQWPSAKLVKPPEIGAVYFDSAARIGVDGRRARPVGNLALAVSLCAALPESAARPIPGVMEKVRVNADARNGIVPIRLSASGQEGLAEFKAVRNRTDVMFRHSHDTPIRFTVPLAQVDRGQANTFFPAALIAKGVLAVIPHGALMQFDRVRLQVYPPGTSQYRDLK
jgi:hypothetical protein